MLGILTTILILAAIAGWINIMFIGSEVIAAALLAVVCFVLAAFIVSIKRNEL